MRRISTLSVLCLAAGVMTACALPDEVITTENIPTAGVRFINAVPDTMMVDFRFLDLVESNAHFRQTFRAAPNAGASTLVQYKGARAGSRHFAVFLDDTLQANAQIKLLDSTFTFEAGKNYTVLMWGNARSAGADKMRFTIYEEAVADPVANVALRLINATSTAVDGYQYLSTGAIGTADWANLAPYTVGTYVNVAPTTGSATRKFHVRDVGGTNSIAQCPDVNALKGAAATADIEAQPGTDVAGSAVTAIIYPGSVAGSKAAQFNVSTGSANQLATATGYEAARSYISDGFCAGMQVTAAGFGNAANNAAAGAPVTIAAVVDGAASGNIGGTGGNRLTADGAGTLTRTGGTSFITQGFAIGQNVTIAGFTTAANNGTATITAVTANTMTTTRVGSLEGGTTGSITMSVIANALGSVGGTYRRSAGSFITDGFVVGHAINAAGFAPASGATPSNNGTATITAISPDGLDMTVSKASGMANEAAAAGRSIVTTANRSITGFGRMDITGGRTAEAAGNGRTITVIPPPKGIAVVWDRRPPRTACSPLC